MKNQYVTDILKDGIETKSEFAIKFKKPPVDYKSKPGLWFDLRLADKTGEITAKYWGIDKAKTQTLYDSLSSGDVVFVSGKTQEYPKGSNTFSISIDGIEGNLRKCSEDEYVMEDFIATTKKDIKNMIEETKNILSTIKDIHLSSLTESFITDKKFLDEFASSPAAMHYHQNYVGGLLEHTLNVMKICEFLCGLYPELDHDLTIAGAFLHDIGKTKELETTSTVIDITDEGMLIGHTTIGYDMVSKKIDTLDTFPEILKLKILHMLLSHNGKQEYGSPKVPQLPEAATVYHADECDAKIDIFLRLKREANTEDAWIWDRKISGHVYLK